MKEKFVFNKWISYGIFEGIGFCIHIDRYSFNVELLCFWFGVEL
jgi:hypothetical protein